MTKDQAIAEMFANRSRVLAAEAEGKARREPVLRLLQQAFDALEATADSDLDTFDDEEEEAEAVPAQYACRKIAEAMSLLRGEQA